MAKLLKMPKGKEFQFHPSKSRGQSKYDWDSWLDGQTWVLEQSIGERGENGSVVNITEKRDYEVPTNYMPAKLKLAGRKRYKVVQVSRVDHNGERLKEALIIRARDMTDDERVDEDLLRAEEREKLKAARSTNTNGEADDPSEDECGDENPS